MMILVLSVVVAVGLLVAFVVLWLIGAVETVLMPLAAAGFVVGARGIVHHLKR